MSAPLEFVVAEALKLNPDERAELIERLIASFEPLTRLQPAWQAEIERRVMYAGHTVRFPLKRCSPGLAR